MRAAPGRDARAARGHAHARGAAALDAASADWKRAQATVAKRLGRERLDDLIAVLGELETLHPDAAGRPQAKAES